jgi:hypothetical protein
MVLTEVTPVEKCPITNSENRFTYINLGDMPLVNNLSETREESLSCKKYPLAVQYFKDSKLSCLTHNVDPNLMFSDYSYKSGVVKAYADHCREMFWFVNSYLFLKGDERVLDIGGNDGTLLQTFLEKHPRLKALNVDASVNLTKLSLDRGINTYTGFWGMETAKILNKKFSLITSTNVFQHTPPISDYVEAVAMSLEKQGLWCLEFPYWRRNMETNQYDQIYHEHVYYYLIEPINTLVEKFGMCIIKAVEYPIHGGSLRLLIGHKDQWSICPFVQNYIKQEQTIDEQYYRTWGPKIEHHISKCREFLISLKKEKTTIVGFGAAAKGCIFLNSAGINHEILDAVIDDTDLKQEKYIPGTGIQIKSREYLKNNNVDYILILAHNFKNEVMQSLKEEYHGQYILMFPEIQVR